VPAESKPKPLQFSFTGQGLTSGHFLLLCWSALAACNLELSAPQPLLAVTFFVLDAALLFFFDAPEDGTLGRKRLTRETNFDTLRKFV
jgi:hypothetical protein